MSVLAVKSNYSQAGKEILSVMIPNLSLYVGE